MPKDSGYARKPQSPDVGWSCAWSFVLIMVTGSVSLGFALMRFGGLHGRDGGLNRNLVDLVQDGGLATTRLSTMPAALNPMDHTVAAAPGFFFDIGASSSAVRGSLRSSFLEKKGWTGVCAVPFPGDFSTRTCRVVALPVSGTSGKQVTVQDCSQKPSRTIAGIIRTLQKVKATCTQVEANTVGIVDLLSLSAAPPVIDYIALDTGGSELDILENFPFNDFCARSWTVKHKYDSASMPQIRHILEVAQGCRVREGAGEYWARCICGKKDNQNPSNDMTPMSGPASMVMHADGHSVSVA